MPKPKSLMEFVCEAINEVLPPGSGVTGRDLYMRGFERYQAAQYEAEASRARREFEDALPLLVPAASEVVEDFSGEDG